MPPHAEPGALPAYLRIAEHLTIEIGTGRMAPGDRLPPERQMAKSYGVSPVTLRKALSVATDRGLIEKRHGSGNYVLGGARDRGIYAFFRLEKVEGGGLPTARVISLDGMSKPADLPGIGSADWAWRIRRIRALDGTPASAEEIWLDPRHAPRLAPSMLSESLYKTYAEKLGFTVVRAEDRVGVDPLPRWAAPEIGLSEGHAMGLVARLSFDQDGQPIEYSQSWFDPARARYVARIP